MRHARGAGGICPERAADETSATVPGTGPRQFAGSDAGMGATAPTVTILRTTRDSVTASG
jgi:hypothetical protein